LSTKKDVLEKATHNALKIMKNAGFEIPDKLEVIVDPKLPFMGYSTKRRGGDVIVLSGMALKSGMIEGLLIHEMSHIYRTNTHHPSHNSRLLDRAVKLIAQKARLTRNYQIAVFRQAINHIQDLYADDVAFRAFGKSEAFPPDQAFNFFLSWIDDKPVDSSDAASVWLNVGIMLSNCFALSNMVRHNVPDVNDQAEKNVQKFLSQTSMPIREGFLYFKTFMTGLKEEVTEKEFEEMLIDYLTRITELAK